MKIVIAGTGKFGAALTRQLTSEGHDLILIDSNKHVLDNLMSKYDVIGVHGNCATMATLREASVEDADILIAATNADEVNLLCCMTAHSLNSEMHTIARIRNPEYADQIYEMRDSFGLSLTVNPENQTAVEIGHMLDFPGFLKRDTFAKGRIAIVELRVEENSKLNGLTLYNLNSVVDCKVLVCAVLRNGEAIMPDGRFTLAEGDRIYVTAPSASLTTLLKKLGIITRKIHRVLILGGGRICYYLAERLIKNGISVEIMEKDYDRCLKLADTLPKASIIHADVANQENLESHNIEEFDAVVSLTGMDEINILSSLYAKNIGCKHIITKLGHQDNMGLLQSLPIGSIICPKDLCSTTIVRYVRALMHQTGSSLSLHSIANGKVEAIEFQVDEHSRHCGKPLKEIKTRKNVLVAGISRAGHTEIASGDSAFHIGDTVIVVTVAGNVLNQFNDIFA